MSTAKELIRTTYNSIILHYEELAQLKIDLTDISYRDYGQVENELVPITL